MSQIKRFLFLYPPLMPTITLGKGKDKRVAHGHPWVFANEIVSEEGEYQAGDIVDVCNQRGNFLGKGYINPASLIRVRILSRKKQENINGDFFKQQIEKAWNYRKSIGYDKNCRIVFGEADGLSGLVVDKFEDILVVQILTLGMDIRRQEIINALVAVVGPKAIYERSDVSVRTLEGLEERTGWIYGEGPTNFVFKQDGIQFKVDIAHGQKTGFFHDQRKNRLSIQPFVKNARVLDACSYTGSFSMYAAKFGAKEVIGLDISQEAIDVCRENAKLNGFSQCEFRTVNVFDELKIMVEKGEQFDVVMLDPPAFTKSRKNLEAALRGYKEINRRGLQLVKPGGYLISSSCSHFIYPEEFKQVITEAANDVGRQLRQVVFQPQSPDHPAIWNIPETLYLKFAILQVV